MSKFDPLWEYVSQRCETTLKLSFEEIGTIAGNPIDHSFLKYKKELLEYGYEVKKISLKDKTVLFSRKGL